MMMSNAGGLWDRLADLIDAPVAGPASSPGALAAQLDPSTVETPALRLIDQHLVAVAEGSIKRLVISMPPQEGKSERVSRRFPLWLLQKNPDLRLGIGSYEFEAARRWGRAIRADVQSHADIGLVISKDSSSAHEWTLDGHRGGVFCAGVGGALTGRALDGLVIDDPVKDRAQAESAVYRDAAWDWWTNVARTRLSPGAWVVVVATRWHGNDLAGRLLADDSEGWQLLNIAARADHSPASGETDPLGREPGEWLESARGRTTEQWQETERAVGARTFASLYQGRPAPAEGGLFKRLDWQRYDQPRAALTPAGTMNVPGADEVLQSWDLAFKDTKASDYVVGQVWARFGTQVFLLDQFRARASFTETVAAVVEMTRRWPQANAKLVEEKANGAAVIDQLRASVSGLIAINPTDSKYVRALAVTPFVEAHQVHIPADTVASWAAGFVEEHASFPNSSHDDQVDAATMALSRLLGRHRGVASISSPVRYRRGGVPAVASGLVSWPGRR